MGFHSLLLLPSPGLMLRLSPPALPTTSSARGLIGEMTDKTWADLSKQVADALNEGNRQKFLAMDPDRQRRLMSKMIDDGIVTWEIKP